MRLADSGAAVNRERPGRRPRGIRRRRDHGCRRPRRGVPSAT
jgi:hypothetical protein